MAGPVADNRDSGKPERGFLINFNRFSLVMAENLSKQFCSNVRTKPQLLGSSWLLTSAIRSLVAWSRTQPAEVGIKWDYSNPGLIAIMSDTLPLISHAPVPISYKLLNAPV